MDRLLEKICEKNGLDYRLIEEIIKIEKNNVYKKTRHIFGDLKEVVYKAVEVEENSSDNN